MNYFDNPGGMIPTWLVNWAAKVGLHTLFEYIRLLCGQRVRGWLQLGEGGSNWERVARTGRGWLELGKGRSNWERVALTGRGRFKMGEG